MMVIKDKFVHSTVLSWVTLCFVVKKKREKQYLQEL